MCVTTNSGATATSDELVAIIDVDVAEDKATLETEVVDAEMAVARSELLRALPEKDNRLAGNINKIPATMATMIPATMIIVTMRVMQQVDLFLFENFPKQHRLSTRLTQLKTTELVLLVPPCVRQKEL